MTDRPLGIPHADPDRSDDRTRNIRLPPIEGRPAARVPAEWAARGDAPVHRHEPPLQEQPVQELPAQPPAGEQPTVATASHAPPQAAPHTSNVPVVEIPAVSASAPAPSTPAVDPDPTVVVAPVGRFPEPSPVIEQSTDQMRPTDAPRDYTRPFVPPSGEALQAARGVQPPKPPVHEDRRGGARARAAETGGTRAWTWVLLVLLPLVVIAAAGVLLFLLLGGG